jgi:predicted oxidoreductase
MERMQLGVGGPLVSRLAYGCAALGGPWDAGELTPERRKQALGALEAALEAGIDHFDLADIYAFGKAEQAFSGIWQLDATLRSRVAVQSKCGVVRAPDDTSRAGTYYDSSCEHILEAARGSLTRLAVEYLDVLVLHRPDVLMEPDEVAAAFDRLHAAGEVRHFGVSNYAPAQIELLLAALDRPLQVNQLQVSLAHPDLIDDAVVVNDALPVRPVRGFGTLAYCMQRSITVQAWAPLGAGRLVRHGAAGADSRLLAVRRELAAVARERGVHPAAVAIAWILRHPAGIQPLLGGRTAVEIQQAARGVDVALTRAEWYRLFNASRGAPVP